MTYRVHRLRVDFEMPIEDVRDFFDGYEPPVDIEDVEVKRRGNKLMINALADRGDSNYTPNAVLKADLNERRLYMTDEGWSRSQPTPKAGVTEDEVETKVVEYASFKGGCGTVLQNTALQHSMFRVLVDLACSAENGELTAIVSSEEGIEATRVVGGEEVPAEVEVVDPTEEEPDRSASDWRDNSLIG